MRSWVYILECSDGSYYTGCTTSLDRRLQQHQMGCAGAYTSSRRPVALKWAKEFNQLKEAIAAERMIKGWTRAKKEALMIDDFDLIHELAQSKEMVARRLRTKHPSR